MRTDPLRVAGWCVVMLAAAVFMLAVEQLSEDQPAPTGTVTTATAEVRSGTPPPVTAAYVGNTRSKKFHALTCQHATCPNCTARFTTRDEAIASGYSPGGCCHP